MKISDLQHDTDNQQFILFVDGHKAFVDYSIEDGQYHLLHSEVPSALRGQGVGKILVEKTFKAIADEGRTAVARCSYVRHVAKNSKQWSNVVS